MSGHHHHHHVHGDERRGLTNRAALASIATATFLLLLKAFAAAQTGSVAMLGSLADTGLDLLASIVTLYGVRLAAQPADHDHRFGHGKAEALVALFQVVIISLSALAIGWRAFARLLEGETTAHAEYGIGVSFVAIAATLVLLAYQRFVIARTGSVAIHADHVHYQSDVLLNAAVIAALALDQYLGIRWADPVFGLAIAAALLWGAVRASSQAVDQLMDREWPQARRAQLLAFAAAHPALGGLHDLRTRTSGTQDFVQFHLYVDPDLTVRAAHAITEEAEEALAAAFPGTEFLIHLDPQGHVDKPGVLPVALAEEGTR